MFTIQKIRDLIFSHDGNHSILYKYVANELENYPDCLLPYKEEFMFFEKKYMLIKETILNYGLDLKTVVDIGCQLGIQNMLFDEYQYIGVDGSDVGEYFFRSKKENVKYLTGYFPGAVDFTLKDKAVISCMSLGYFEPDAKDIKDGSLSKTQKLMIEKLKESKYLFVSSTKVFNNELSKHFKHVEPLLFSEMHGEIMYNMYFMTNEVIERRPLEWAVDPFYLVDEAIDMHHTPEDFEEGDIVDRIHLNKYYNLQRVSLSDIQEVPYSIDDYLVDEYMAKNMEEMPPVILGIKVNRERLIIDGSHRITALRNSGVKTVMAYVPVQVFEPTKGILSRKIKAEKMK